MRGALAKKKREKKGKTSEDIVTRITSSEAFMKSPILVCTLKLYVHICQRATLPPATFMINLDLSDKNSEQELIEEK